MIKKYLLIGLVSLFSACSSPDLLFEKVKSDRTGIDFKNTVTESDDFNIIDYLYFYNGGGVAVGDINGDELPDIFFSGNQVKNKLYLNLGNLKFKDISESAGITGNSTWNTGSVMGDVNGDGLLDIYVCAVVGLKGLNGYNELFINNGDNTFSEKAAEYGLDFDSYSSSAAFLDYDLDGDLDMYVLNHAIHTQESFGHADLRNKRTYQTGDKLMRNENGKFTDVSEEAGIFGGVNGYGLGISISDFNVDGYPDIYIGNDFHEDDYYYINKGDGTFTESARQAFTQTSRFSMGNDASDINHDGYPDLISLDMLSDDELVLKRSEGDENISIMKLRTSKYGYHYQFARNMLQINQGDGGFAETALMSGVAATDWSWSALFADFDQDGNQDLFISNGIPRRPNDMDYIKFVSSDQIVGTIGQTKLVDQKALELMPSGRAKNCVFKGRGNFGFEDVSALWLTEEYTYSTATALGDLDGDGDMDIVINNVNGPPGIYINQIDANANHLKIRLNYSQANPFGIGTKVQAYQGGVLQFKELYTARGFQASSEPIIHFGFGSATKVDSINVVWPDGRLQKLKDVPTNQTLVLKPESDLKQFLRPQTNEVAPLFEIVGAKEMGLDFVHIEDSYTDFDRLKLLPYQQSDRGPATALGDLNNDGLVDVFFGGAKFNPSQVYLQTMDGFSKFEIPSIAKDSIKEDVAAVIGDFNQDGQSDLFIGTGGADFYGKSKPLLNSYYEFDSSAFDMTDITLGYENTAVVKAADFDADGDLDLFVGNQSISNDFGRLPDSYLLQNDQGTFNPIRSELFTQLGMVTDAVWSDFDGDGLVDLVVVGEWMSPAFFKNNQGTFEREEVLTETLKGLWQSVAPIDIDADGDLDYVLGNWGLNSKFKASAEYPMTMYYKDFDENGSTETVIAIEKNGSYYPLDGLDMLAGQMSSMRKKFTNYKDFAGKTIDEVFSKTMLKSAKKLEVSTLASGYLKNTNGVFEFYELPDQLQISPIMAMMVYDFDVDGIDEVLMAGNYFGVQPFHGRYSSFAGAILDSNGEIVMGDVAGLELKNQSVRDLNIISVKDKNYLLVTINNGSAQMYRLLK